MRRHKHRHDSGRLFFNRAISRLLSAVLPLALIAACASPQPATPEESPASASSSRNSAATTQTPDSTQYDRALQKTAADALGDVEGTVLVMDPQTGRLRAVVNPRLAFEQSFPPGSTIKSFTALMALRAGLLDGDTRSLC